MADEPVAPPLPDGSVDFNAIHAAARQNHNLGEAIAKATFVHPDKATVAEGEASAPATEKLEPAADPKTAKKEA